MTAVSRRKVSLRQGIAAHWDREACEGSIPSRRITLQNLGSETRAQGCEYPPQGSEPRFRKVVRT